VRKENTAMGTVDKLKDSVDIIEKIKTLPAMESFGEKDLQELLRISKIVRYAPGELIVDESSYDGWIYYLIAGRVRIAKAGNDLAVLQRTGDVFGEVGGMGREDLSRHEASCPEKARPHLYGRAFHFHGGESGIRTHGRAFDPTLA
jgi:hypothetical protein